MDVYSLFLDFPFRTQTQMLLVGPRHPLPLAQPIFLCGKVSERFQIRIERKAQRGLGVNSQCCRHPLRQHRLLWQKRRRRARGGCRGRAHLIIFGIPVQEAVFVHYQAPSIRNQGFWVYGFRTTGCQYNTRIRHGHGIRRDPASKCHKRTTTVFG